jgi:hypothetical protein
MMLGFVRMLHTMRAGEDTEFSVMDYIGIDPAVGLECSHCQHISRVAYSELLALVMATGKAECQSCSRKMLHDWTTVSLVQNIIRKRMHEANEMKSGQLARGNA